MTHDKPEPPDMRGCHDCISDNATDCAGLLWGAMVIEADEDQEPYPGDWDQEPCTCQCHQVST